MAPATLESLIKNFHSEIGPEKLEWVMTHFKGNKTIKDMFTFLWDLKELHKHVNPQLRISMKSETEALKFLAEGDEYYMDKCYREALEHYNLSLMNAPYPTFTSSDNEIVSKVDFGLFDPEKYAVLASVYAKRSAALYKVGQYEFCLKDINAALALGYDDKKKNLENRKFCCRNMLNNTSEINGDATDEFLDLQKISYIAKGAQKCPKLVDNNPSIPSFSNALKVVYSRNKGRHVIAERDIKPGEILAVEKSCCSSLDLDKLPAYCSTCLVKCLAPVPCPECTMVVFCSDTCRAEGQTEHWLECRIFASMKALEMYPVFCISFKVFQDYSCTQLREIMKHLQEVTEECPNDTKISTKDGISIPPGIRALHHFNSNKNMRQRGDLYVKCMIAFIILKLLLQSDRFFVNSYGEFEMPSREDILFTGQMLVSNQLKISCNGFKVVEILCGGNLATMDKINIGSAIFPSLFMFNHSCNPNAEPYSYGTAQVVKSTRSIPAGSEVNESYIRGFYMQSFANRQKNLLNVYQFQCECDACKAKWPTYQELPSALQFICLDCQKPVSENTPVCKNCFLDYSRNDYELEKQEKIDEWRETGRQVREAFYESQKVAAKILAGEPTITDDLRTICNAITLMEKHSPFPCQPVWDAHDAIDLYFHRERENDLREIDVLQVN